MRIEMLSVVGEHQKGAVITVEDSTGQKYIDAGLAKAASSDGAAALDGLAATIKQAITSGVAAGVAEIESVSKLSPEERAKRFRIDAGEQEADRTKSFGDQLVQIGVVCNHESTPRQREEANSRLEKVYKSIFREWNTKAGSTMVENDGALGGYGVFPEYTQEIFRIAIEDTVFAYKARRRPMSGNQLFYPKLDQTGTQATNQTGYLGGVVAGWANETKTGNQTNAKLKQGILKTGELVGYTVISNELLADNAVGLEATIRELFAEAIAYYLDLATLIGDGADKPMGVVNATATLTTGPNSGGRTTANSFVYADATWLVSKLLPKSRKTAMWIFNQTVMPQLFSMKDGSNRNIWLPNFPGGNQGPVAQAGSTTFLDLPYFFTEKTPVLGTPGDVLLVDPLGYLIGERMGLEIAASPHVNFLNREMTYRFVARVGGQPLLDKPFTMIDGTNQLSTFVALN